MSLIKYIKKQINATLSLISYVNLNNKDDDTRNFINKNLVLPDNNQDFLDGFMEYLAEGGSQSNIIHMYSEIDYSLRFFAQNFKIIDQIVTTGLNGFSAITYQLQNDILGTDYKAGQVFISYRGTEATQPGDILSDMKLSLTSIAGWPGSQEYQAVEYLRNAIKNNTDVVVCGHSLGGYLAARSFYYLSKDDAKKVKEVFTFNGAGFSSLIGNPFIKQNKEYGDKVENIFAYRGLEVTTGNLNEFLSFNGNLSLFQHLGKRTQTFTENPGWMDNHSMSLLVTSLGFYSTLETLLDNQSPLKDVNGKELTGAEKDTYAIEKIFMRSVGFEDDYGSTLIDIAYAITECFGIKTRVMVDPNDTDAESVVSKFIELQNYFAENQNLKIKLISNSDSVVGDLKDTNKNRSLMYSLINNLTFYAVVPEDFREGIYDRNTANDMYNIENYSEEYLSYRIAFNQVYSYILESKIARSLPSSISFKDIYINGMNAQNYKFVFGEQLKASNITSNELIYINTNETESTNLNTPSVLFKSYFSSILSSVNKNSIMFGSSSNDVFRIAHDDVTLNVLSGRNTVNINTSLKNVRVVISDKTKSAIIYNNADKIYKSELVIQLDSYKLSKTIFKKKDILSKNNIQSSILLIQNNQEVEIFGEADLLIEGVLYSYKDISQRITVLEAAFVDGNSIELNNQLLDKYIANTKVNGAVDVKNSIPIPANQNYLNESDANQLKEDLANLAPVQMASRKMAMRALATVETPKVYGKLPGLTYEQLSAYIDSKVQKNPLVSSCPAIVNEKVIPLLDKEIANPFTRSFINEKLEYFKNEKYATNIVLVYPNGCSIFNIYYIENHNVNYTAKNENGVESSWIWDGSNNFDGSFYSVMFMNLKNANTTKENENYVIRNHYRKSVTILSESSSISGTNGSDILYGYSVTSQSPYFGESGGIVSPQKSPIENNGDSILIGVSGASAYSGKNLIYSPNISSGKDEELLIATGGGELRINSDYKNNLESESTQNTVISIGSNKIYSSNGKNNILTNTRKSAGVSDLTVFATGQDTVIAEKGIGLDFIGGADAYQLAKDSGYFRPGTAPELVSFYDFYKVNRTPNRVYSGSERTVAFLSKNDFGDFSKIQEINTGPQDTGIVYGVGYNKIIINSKTLMQSGGNSEIKVLGVLNTINLKEGDSFDLSESSNNTIDISKIKNQNLQTYTINGEYNKLLIGSSIYQINFNGNGSKLVLAEDNTNQINLNIDENKINEIIIGANISSLNINTNNDFNVYSNLYGFNINHLSIISTDFKGSDSILKSLNVDNVSLNIKSVLNIAKLVSNLIDIETDKNLTITETKSPIVKINSKADINIYDSNITEIDINSSSLFPSGNYIKINATEKTETLKIQSDNVNTIVDLNGEITNSNLEKSTLKGYFKTDKLVLKGVMDGAAINSDTGVDIKVDGYINKLQLTNATNFDYKEYRAGVVKSDVTIMNSSITNDITQFKNVDLKVFNSHLNNITLDGFDINVLVDSESSVNNVDIKASVKSNISIHPKSANVKFSNDTLRVNADNTNNTEISTTNDGYSVSVGESSGIRLNSNDGKTVSLSASKIGDLYLDNGIIDANVPQVNNLFVNFSKVRLLNSNVLKVANNLKVNTTDKIRYYNGSKCYLNGVLLQKRPEEIVVGNKVYSGIILDEIDNYMTLNTVYAYLTEGEVEYHPVNDTDLQFNQDPTEDRGNEIIGTGENNIINIEQNQSLRILGNETEMTYNFSGDMNYQHVFNYIRNNGLCTFNSTSYPDITIKLNGVNKSDITYDYNKDLVSLESTLKVKNKGVLIVIINNYDLFSMNLSVLDNGKYVRLEDEDIRAIVEVKDPTDPTTPVDPTDPTDPTTPIDPTIPSGSVITGTDGNDYYQLTESKLYTINSSKGNDTYEFTVANSNQSVLNYTIGSGLSNIKTSPNNYLFLNIVLKDIDRSLISYNVVKNQIGTQSKLTILYENNSIITIDNFIDVYLNLKLVNGSDVKEIDNTEINDIVFGIYGTDGDDVLTGNTTTTLFNPGKGNDILNIMGGNNTVYYRVGDGHKTIVNPTFAYTGILMKGDADLSLLSYQLADDNGLYVKYNGELIFTLLQPGSSSLQIEGRNEFVNFYQVVQDLQTIYGTDGDDVLTGNGSGTTIIETKKGNDIINLLGGQNSINYTIGNGYKTVNSENVSYTLNVTGVLNKELLTYEKNGLSAMDIKYDGVLIFTLQDPFSGTICLMEKYEYIYLSQIYQGLNTIKGTDGDDIIYGLPNGGAIIPGKGTDEINLTGGFNTLHYDFGIGIKHIKGEFPCMFQMYGDFDIDLFEFRKNGNSMDVIYNGDMILTIEYPLLCYMILNETGGFVNLSAFMH